MLCKFQIFPCSIHGEIPKNPLSDLYEKGNSSNLIRCALYVGNPHIAGHRVSKVNYDSITARVEVRENQCPLLLGNQRPVGMETHYVPLTVDQLATGERKVVILKLYKEGWIYRLDL